MGGDGERSKLGPLADTGDAIYNPDNVTARERKDGWGHPRGQRANDAV